MAYPSGAGENLNVATLVSVALLDVVSSRHVCRRAVFYLEASI